MALRVVDRMRGSQCVQAQPAGSKWNRALPAGSKWQSALPTGSRVSRNAVIISPDPD